MRCQFSLPLCVPRRLARAAITWIADDVSQRGETTAYRQEARDHYNYHFGGRRQRGRSVGGRHHGRSARHVHVVLSPRARCSLKETCKSVGYGTGPSRQRFRNGREAVKETIRDERLDGLLLLQRVCRR